MHGEGLSAGDRPFVAGSHWGMRLLSRDMGMSQSGAGNWHAESPNSSVAQDMHARAVMTRKWISTRLDGMRNACAPVMAVQWDPRLRGTGPPAGAALDSAADDEAAVAPEGPPASARLVGASCCGASLAGDAMSRP